MSHEDGPVTATIARTAAASKLDPVRLTVLEGNDRGREFLLKAGTAVIGSRSDCELVLTDPAVSRRHLSVELLGKTVRVRDLGSKNGTLYQGARIDTLEAAVGVSFRLGETQLAILPERVATGALSGQTQLGRLVGRSLRMRKLFAEIERAAPSDASILIRGETGTGKEEVARSVHLASSRASGPLRFFDCASVQPELLPSALFGHVKGAFTGAIKDSSGALEEANKGTLVLDEIGELPIELQPALLRALETKSFVRVGESVTRRSDFRIVAATHQDLEARVSQGKFRQDLYYRLAAIVLEVPALRERSEDIPLLVEHFAREAKAPLMLTPALNAALSAYRWPGNVRELRNMVERGIALGPEAVVPGGLVSKTANPEQANFHEARETAIKAFERSYLEALLERHNGSASAAAREAKIARSYLYRLLDQHGLRGPRAAGSDDSEG